MLERARNPKLNPLAAEQFFRDVLLTPTGAVGDPGAGRLITSRPRSGSPRVRRTEVRGEKWRARSVADRKTDIPSRAMTKTAVDDPAAARVAAVLPAVVGAPPGGAVPRDENHRAVRVRRGRARIIAGRHLMRELTLIATAFIVHASVAAPASQRGDNKNVRPAAIRMDDGFEYALLDFGVGTVPKDIPRRAGVERFLWLKFRLTNTLSDRLSRPAFWNFSALPPFPPTDNFGNEYPVSSHTVSGVVATTTGRYKPGESSIELLMIPTDELLDNVKEIRIGLGESGGFWKRYQFFALEQPMTRTRDFDPNAPEPDAALLPAKARSSLLPPDRSRR